MLGQCCCCCCCVLLMHFFPRSPCGNALRLCLLLRFVCSSCGEEANGGTAVVLMRRWRNRPSPYPDSFSIPFHIPPLHSRLSQPLPPPTRSTAKLLHDKQMTPVRFSRGRAHGNVSGPHNAFGLKTDVICRMLELAVPFIAECLFRPQSRLVTRKTQEKPWDQKRQYLLQL